MSQVILITGASSGFGAMRAILSTPACARLTVVAPRRYPEKRNVD